MRILITGAGGFLGGAVARSLHAAGHELVLFVRRPDSVATIPRAALEQGDVRDRDALTRAAQGCQAIVHLAALVKRWAKDRSSFEAINVGGLQNVLHATQVAGVEKLLYSSSFIALGPTDGVVGDEDHRHDGWPRNDYERTKWLADRRAREAQAQGAPLVVVYPGVVYGAGKITDGNVVAQAARDLLRGKLPGTIGPGDRRWCFSLVDDVALGIVAALQQAPVGSRYILGGENLTVRQSLQIVAEAGGVPMPRRAIPYPLSTLLGKLLRWQARLTGIEPFLTDEEVEIYKHDWAYSSARAERELGYRITPARQGLGEMVNWLQRGQA